MKYVKMLGLAAVAAAALMAFVGASTASATVLCKVEGTGPPTGTTCPANSAYPAGTEVHAVLDPGTGPAKLVTSFKTIECKASTVKGSTSNEGSATETVKGTIEAKNLTFSECNCEVKVLAGGSLEIHWGETIENEKKEKEWRGDTGHDATLTSTGAEVTSECSTVFGLVHCIYKTNGTTLGVLTHGNPATMDIENSNIPRLVTNPLCAEKAEWSAKYEVTTPKPLFVAAHT